MSSCATYDRLTYYTDDQNFLASINCGRSEPYPDELVLVRKYVKIFNKSGAFIDVGAHIGTTALPYSRLFRQVIAYEPNDKNYGFLLKNIECNAVKKIQTFKKGVSDSEYRCQIIAHEGGNSGCFYLKPVNGELAAEPSANSAAAPIVTAALDNEYQSWNLTCPIDFIKVDTEGGELLVLRGARQLIREYQPLIQVEINQCSEKYFGINPAKLLDYLSEMGYVRLDDFHQYTNQFFFVPTLIPSTVDAIFCFWTGNNSMSDSRKKCLDSLTIGTQCRVVLVTPDNLDRYLLDSEPLHPAFQYLSETHKADYLRTYFMNFIGGGYSDIKIPGGSWLECFKNLNNSNYWICGYQEIHGGVNPPISDQWMHLVGNCAYICKPQTPLTRKWYRNMISVLDTKLPMLRGHPAGGPQDCQEHGGGYPIRWCEILGDIFHPIALEYQDRLLRTLPVPVFQGYR